MGFQEEATAGAVVLLVFGAVAGSIATGEQEQKNRNSHSPAALSRFTPSAVLVVVRPLTMVRLETPIHPAGWYLLWCCGLKNIGFFRELMGMNRCVVYLEARKVLRRRCLHTACG